MNCALLLLILGATIEAKTVSVESGDSLLVSDAGGQQIQIRLNGIDAPDEKQPYAKEAKEALAKLVQDQPLKIETSGEDRYKRTIGVVTVGETNINQKLVRDGMAWWFRRYAPDDKTLEAAEKEAREAKRGLWADPSPVAPWDFRQQERDKKEGEKKS
jgi:endonuclease YncB( thermonuclease family)